MATITYKCPNCGGGLEFDPSEQNYKCQYCLSQFTQEELDRLNPDADSALLYTCPSCGAEIATDQTTAATFCYYCHNPVVLSGRLSGQFHPDYLVPFAIGKEKATHIFVDWIGKKKFVPKAFFSQDQIQKLSGVYFPYWLYSCQVEGEMEADCDKIRTWVTGEVQFTETKQYKVQREGTMEVRNVTRNALKKANRQLVEGVLPFPMEEVKPFSMGYLSGFVAEMRDMEQGAFEGEIQEEVKEFALGSLKNSLGAYDAIRVDNARADISRPDWRYALMPVWTLTYRDDKKGKTYYFALNGQTGKICGELPVDMKKLAILFAEIFFPLLVVLLVLGYLI